MTLVGKQQTNKQTLMVLQILFWVLLILSALGYFFPLPPHGMRIHGGVILILIAILGFKVFGGFN